MILQRLTRQPEKKKKMPEDFSYQTNTGSTIFLSLSILGINVLNEHSTRGGEQLILPKREQCRNIG